MLGVHIAKQLVRVMGGEISMLDRDKTSQSFCKLRLWFDKSTIQPRILETPTDMEDNTSQSDGDDGDGGTSQNILKL